MDPYTYGLHNYGLYRNGLYSVGLNKHGLYTYGRYDFGLHSRTHKPWSRYVVMALIVIAMEGTADSVYILMAYTVMAYTVAHESGIGRGVIEGEAYLAPTLRGADGCAMHELERTCQIAECVAMPAGQTLNVFRRFSYPSSYLFCIGLRTRLCTCLRAHLCTTLNTRLHTGLRTCLHTRLCTHVCSRDRKCLCYVQA